MYSYIHTHTHMHTHAHTYTHTRTHTHSHTCIVVSQVNSQENGQLIICRIYACIADMLAFMADEGGIRGGPAANLAWKTAFDLLEVSLMLKRPVSPMPTPSSVPCPHLAQSHAQTLYPDLVPRLHTLLHNACLNLPLSEKPLCSSN